MVRSSEETLENNGEESYTQGEGGDNVGFGQLFGESLNYFFFLDGPATFHRPVRIGHFSRKLKMAIAAWSAPLCAGLAGNHGVSFTAVSILKIGNVWSVAAMDARSVRARMAPSSREGGAGLPFRPTRSQRSGDQEPRSHDATTFLVPGLSAPVTYFRLCGP